MTVSQTHSADVLVVGWGLAGIVAASEAAAAGKSVVIVDQESRPNLGGQAFWSFGGLLFIDSPEQRRMGIKDSYELARRDWFATAGFDRAEDHWPRQWAEAYLQFAHTEKRAWLREKGVGFFPVVGWAERGGYTATGPGNSVPRFHITWGTGPGIVAPFQAAVESGEAAGRITILPRHKVTQLTTVDGTVVGLGRHPRAFRCGPRSRDLARGGRIVPRRSIRHDRLFGGNRRKPRSRARPMAGAPRHASGERSAHSHIFEPPAMTTHGSSCRARSSRKSSPCRAANRIRTSPTRTFPCS